MSNCVRVGDDPAATRRDTFPTPSSASTVKEVTHSPQPAGRQRRCFAPSPPGRDNHRAAIVKPKRSAGVMRVSEAPVAVQSS
ncbi:unnamed protein product [Pleuronectes platessa]|uniref:Uncharacterized protein n=1 Tax=Pleuronectes platessa TaxID=8262 RepID=A0A9N7V327_PLEPL|nr:unnamed protein product [Pleuronectes platessa]